MRVVIVGGGLAGLSAAESLARHNAQDIQVTLVEAKRSAGGRAGSFIDPASGETVDYCQHVAMGCCTNFLSLFERCGLGEQFHQYKELTFLHPDHAASRFAPSTVLPPPLHLSKTIGALKYLTGKQKREVRSGLWRLMRTPAGRLGTVKAKDWLDSNGQSPETILRFWDVILVSALGEQTAAVSMAAARKVLVDGFTAAKGASDVYVPKIPLSELVGGKLLARIENLGVKVITKKPVRQVCDANDLPSIRLSDETELVAEHVICAVPWYRLQDILCKRIAARIPDLKSIGEFPASPITGLHLWFDQEFTDLPHAVMVGTISQWLFRDPTNSDTSDSEHYYQVVISASQEARQLGKDDLIDQVVAEIQNAFPRAKQAKLLRARIVTDPKSVFSVCPDVEAKRPASTTPLNWLHLAGDWTLTGWPATMEGAVISGALAANSIRKQCRLPEQTIDPGLKQSWLSRLLIR